MWEIQCDSICGPKRIDEQKKRAKGIMTNTIRKKLTHNDYVPLALFDVYYLIVFLLYYSFEKGYKHQSYGVEMPPSDLCCKIVLYSMKGRQTVGRARSES